jgi:predicted RNA-binding Zn-ribbon protein involved in translation (DUF1610 family)
MSASLRCPNCGADAPSPSATGDQAEPDTYASENRECPECGAELTRLLLPDAEWELVSAD